MKIKAKGAFKAIGSILGAVSLFGGKPKTVVLPPPPVLEKTPEAPKVSRVEDLDSSSAAAAFRVRRDTQRVRRQQQSQNLFDLSIPKTSKKTLLGD